MISVGARERLRFLRVKHAVIDKVIRFFYGELGSHEF